MINSKLTKGVLDSTFVSLTLMHKGKCVMKKTTKILSALVVAAAILTAVAFAVLLPKNESEVREAYAPTEVSYNTQQIKNSDNYIVVSDDTDSDQLTSFVKTSCVNKIVLKNSLLMKKDKKLSDKAMSQLKKLAALVQHADTAAGVFMNISSSSTYIAQTADKIGCDELFLSGTEKLAKKEIDSYIKKIKSALKKEKCDVSLVLCLDENRSDLDTFSGGTQVDKLYFSPSADTAAFFEKVSGAFKDSDKLVFSFDITQKTADEIEKFDTLSFSTGRSLGSFKNAESQEFETIDLYLKGLAHYSGGFVKNAESDKIISAFASQKKTIEVTVLSRAAVCVKLGAQKFEAEETEYIGGGFSLYSAEVTFPQTKGEIDSIGTVGVNVTFGGETKTQTIGTVVYREQESTDDIFGVENAKETENEKTSATQNASDAPTQIVTAAPDTVENMQAQSLCVVTDDAADTWLSSTSDDRFTPFTSNLIKGTVDYIVGESDAYDSEQSKTRNFYNLSCGRRVLKSSVQILAKTQMPQNSLTVLSSNTLGGELEIKFAQGWKSAFTFAYTPQEYYSQSGRLYNVSSFTASSIAFTFYHTSSYSGSVNVQGSDVVSGASFSQNSQNGTVTLTMPLINQGHFYGYSAKYDESENLVITIHSRPKSLYGAVILLDPGHGGDDVGAESSGGAIKEADLNLSVAAMVKTKLEQKGAAVYSTRYSNESKTLAERKSMIYSLKPDIFVSIHTDAAESTSAAGTSAFYFKPMSSQLAKCIHERLVSAYMNTIYNQSDANYSKIDRGTRFHPFSVTRVEDCPSVLIEMGFITNAVECSKLSYAENREKIAAAIADGIEDYYKLQ